MKRTEIFLQYFGLLFFILFILILLLLFPNTLLIALIAFLPTLLHIIISLNKNKILIWIFPLVMAVLYYFAYSLNLFYSEMDIMMIILLNLVASYTFTMVLFVVGFFNSQFSYYKTESYSDLDLNSYQAEDYKKTITDLESRYNKVQDELNLKKLNLHIKEKEIYEHFLKYEHNQNDFSKFKNKEKKLNDKIDTLNQKIIDIKKKNEEINKIRQTNQMKQNNEMKQINKIELNNKKTNIDLFKENLRTLESDCKAINFVIGRVFSKKNGSNLNFRKPLQIKPNLYNSFSKLSNKIDPKTTLKLLAIVKEIYLILKRFKLSLNEFNNGLNKKDRIVISKFLNSQNNIHSSESILDILDKADQDPVKDYYSKILSVCIQLISYGKKSFK